MKILNLETNEVVENPDVIWTGFQKIDEELLDKYPSVKLVASRTTALDHINLELCKERGIEVISLRGSDLNYIVAVPELCLLKMLELVRRDRKELKGKTIGVIGGQGRIGRWLVQYAWMLGMNPISFDKGDTLDLGKCDIVSLNITADEENRGFMNRQKFEQMKDGAYFLNSARPWLVDEDAFKWALENKLTGAWVDFDLGFTHPRLITTPHIGGSTIESKEKTEKILMDKILQWEKSR